MPHLAVLCLFSGLVVPCLILSCCAVCLVCSSALSSPALPCLRFMGQSFSPPVVLGIWALYTPLVIGLFPVWLLGWSVPVPVSCLVLPMPPSEPFKLSSSWGWFPEMSSVCLSHPFDLSLLVGVRVRTWWPTAFVLSVCQESSSVASLFIWAFILYRVYNIWFSRHFLCSFWCHSFTQHRLEITMNMFVVLLKRSLYCIF